jgi:translocation and assembly module TamB
VVRIDRLRGGIEAEDGRLRLDGLTADTDRGRFALRGEYAPRERYRMDLVATAVLPAAPGRMPARLGATARGDLAALQIALGGSMPGPLRASLELRGEQTPRWRLDAHGERLRLSALSGLLGLGDAEDADDEPSYALTLRMRGEAGAANAEGQLAQTVDTTTAGAARSETRELKILPSKLALEGQVLTLAPLSLALLDGRVDVRGRLDARTPADPRFDGRLTASGLRWRGQDRSAVEITGDGEFALRGRWRDWSANGRAALLRADERAQIELEARGDGEHADIARLAARMPSGRLDGRGRVDWAPRLRWRADAALAGFDPGYLWPDWPGAVNGRLRSEGATDERGATALRIEASELGGRLRERALQGRADLRLRLPAAPQTRIDGEGELALRIGESRVDARGTVADTLALSAEFAPLRMSDLWPQAQGLVRGRLRLSGARAQPNLEADLSASDLRYAGYRAARLHARGRLPWAAGGDGAFLIEADGVEAGIALDRARVEARGAWQSLRIAAEGDSETLGGFALDGDVAQRGGRWQGNLQRLRLTPASGPAWRLQAPARFAQTAANGWQLSSSCFRREAGDGANAGNASSGALCASADWPARVDIRGEALPLAWLAPYLEPSLPARDARTQWIFAGVADVDAQIRAAGAGAPWTGSAQLRSAEGGLVQQRRARRDVMVYRDLRADARFDAQGIQTTLEAGLRREGSVRARIAAGWDAEAPLSGEIAVDARELTWMELFSPDIVAPSGRLSGTVTLAGRRAQPSLGGQAQLSDFQAELPALAVSLREGDVRMDAQADGSARIVGRVRSGEGLLRVDGALGWRDPATPLRLSLRGENVLIADTRELHAIVDPNVEVRYAVGQPVAVSGEVRIVKAELALERLSEGVSASPDVVVLDPANPQRSASTALDLDLALTMGRDVHLYGFGLDGTLDGSVRMRARPGRETLATGTLDVDGRYTAYGQKLRIERGRLLWSNTPFADPVLDLRAQREVGEVTAGIDVKGRASAPDARIWSDPATSESEALAYLALGRPLSTASADENRRLSAATAALSAGNLLAAQLGQKIGLDDAGVLESRALGGSVLGVGKYLSPRLYVSYGVSLLGTGQVITLKYLLRKGFDIEIESSTVENRGSVNWRHEQ